MDRNQKNLAVAKAYYRAMGDNNVEGMALALHPDVEFKSPQLHLTGKTAYVEALKGFIPMVNAVTVRAGFGEGDQAMFAYDIDFKTDIERLSTAALLTFKEGLIVKADIFCDVKE